MHSSFLSDVQHNTAETEPGGMWYTRYCVSLQVYTYMYPQDPVVISAFDKGRRMIFIRPAPWAL